MTLDKWLSDMPVQFQDKKNITILISAIADELDELEAVYADMRNLLDIDSQSGINLDHIGDIVSMTRHEAYTVLNESKEAVVSDADYRNVLKFKILQNTSDCTYEDIMEGIRLLGNGVTVHYREDNDMPATYILDLGEWDIRDETTLRAITMTIRAAGVKVYYMVSWDIYATHEDWHSYIPYLEMGTSVPFFTGVLRLDGTVQLDGSVQLDAATQGTGLIDYYLYATGWGHTASVETADMTYGYEWLSVTAEDDAVSVSTSEIGVQTDSVASDAALSAAYSEDGLDLTYEADAAFGVAG